MNRFLPIIIAVCFMVSCIVTPVTAEQTPINTNCNGSSQIVWELNPETDMEAYRLYSKSTAGITNRDIVLVTVGHRTGTIIWDNQGKAKFHENFKSGWAEGAIWFALSAVDTKGNESPLSAEVGCDLDIAPGMPLGITIVRENGMLQILFQKG